MQKNIFVGRLASAPALTNHGNGTKVAKFRLLSDEYAGKDEGGDSKKETVGLNFTAFGERAQAIADHCREGDQMVVDYRIRNNNYEKNGETVYDFNFIVDQFEFGAPGQKKREELNNR